MLLKFQFFESRGDLSQKRSRFEPNRLFATRVSKGKQTLCGRLFGPGNRHQRARYWVGICVRIAVREAVPQRIRGIPGNVQQIGAGTELGIPSEDFLQVGCGKTFPHRVTAKVDDKGIYMDDVGV